jgi:hypothetical protein
VIADRLVFLSDPDAHLIRMGKPGSGAGDGDHRPAGIVVGDRGFGSAANDQAVKPSA